MKTAGREIEEIELAGTIRADPASTEMSRLYTEIDGFIRRQIGP
jgi:hypothetical protein